MAMYGLLNRFFDLREGGHSTVHDVMSAFSVLFFSLQNVGGILETHSEGFDKKIVVEIC